MRHDYEWPMSIAEIRHALGQKWGLDRPLTRTELGRAMNLSDKNGGDYVARLEKKGETFTSTAEVAVRMMLAGAVPHTMGSVVKPGYPRGPVM